MKIEVFDVNGNLKIAGPGGSSGTASPLTTKGDLYTYDTTNNRLPVGANNSVLVADSAQSTGNKWSAALTGLTLDNSQIGSSVPSSGIFTNLSSDNQAIKVLNNSGATANQNEVGYITYSATNGAEYKTTSIANLDGVQWCVVVNGGGNGANIFVALRGQVTVKLNANCSIGNFLLTSTTVGQASVSTTMRPEVFAVALTANGGGAGGTCTALLLTLTRYVPASNANLLYSNAAHSTTAFIATINGAPTATSVVYNVPSSGSDNVLVPGAGVLLKARLYNTTRGTFRLISSVNTGTKTITTVSNTDSWASGDTINIESTTCVSGAVYKMIELDMAQSVQTTVPLLARAVNIGVSDVDTAVGFFSSVHQFEAFALSKLKNTYNQAANTTITIPYQIPIISAVICWGSQANGTGTGQSYYSLEGYWEAMP